VAFRSAAHLGGCFDALFRAAAGLALELVVVDNASGDGTPALVERAAPGARLIVNEINRGFAAAVNQAGRAAAGRHLLLLNPDARPEPDCIRRLLAELEATPGAALVAPQLVYEDGAVQPSAWPAPGLLALGYDALLLHNLWPRSRLRQVSAPGSGAVDVDCLSGACLLVRRQVFEALGGLDERFFIYYEDTDLGLRARRAGYRLRLVSAARAVHLVGGSAFQDRREFLFHFYRSRRLFLEKHHRGVRGGALRAAHWGGLALRAGLYAAIGLASGPRRAQARDHAAVLWRLLQPAAGRS
jgi:GT2 family glycosyltransferase